MSRKKTTASDGVALTKSDVTLYSPAYDALYVGTGGHVTLVSPKGTTAEYRNVPNGGLIRAQFVKILNASTAADFVGMMID